jgi:hypothetical protein
MKKGHPNLFAKVLVDKGKWNVNTYVFSFS